jgi:hypothetical protein
VTPTQYAADELAVVAQLLGAPAFPGVDRLGEPGEREASLRTARRCLLARGVLQLDGEGILSITAPHALLFSVALAPAASILAVRRRGDAESRAWYIHPKVAVEHTVPVGAVHGLEEVAAADVVPRVVEFLELGGARETGEPAGFPASRLAVDRAAGLLATGDTGGARSELPTDADAFAAAVDSFTGLAYVRALHRSGTKIVGGELSWIDTGDAGLWLVEPVPADPDRVAVRRTGSQELVDELLSYLPGGEPQPAI